MKNNGLYAGGEAFDRIFKALGDPHRIQIVELLRERELSAGEILDGVDVVQSTLSHHMKTLSDSGVVNAVRRGKWTWYSLNEDVLSDAVTFLQEYAKGTKQRKPEGSAKPDREANAGSSSTPVRNRRNGTSSPFSHRWEEKAFPPREWNRQEKESSRTTRSRQETEAIKAEQSRKETEPSRTEKGRERKAASPLAAEDAEGTKKKKDKKNKKGKKKK